MTYTTCLGTGKRHEHRIITKVARDAARLRGVAHEVSNILTYNIFKRCIRE